MAIYRFDKALRHLLIEATTFIEISLRARWAYVLGHKYGPQAHEAPKVFRDGRRHEAALVDLDEGLNRSREPFIAHYRKKYGAKRPPIWAACEVMSFGLLSRFYENILRDRDKKDIANTYGFGIDNLKSLLQHAVYIRNLCAHHSRVWNRRWVVTVSLPKSSPSAVIVNLHPPEHDRLYNSLVLLIYMVGVIEPCSDWARRLLAHVRTLDVNLLSSMGFPADWESRPMWAALFAG